MTFTPNLLFSSRPLGAYSKASDGNSYPNTLDMRDLVLKTEDQGMTSKCAAYTATSWIEAILWRKTGKPVDFDPDALYKKAKELDGRRYEEGTTLEAILKAMIQLGWMKEKTEDDIVTFYDMNGLKKAIHRYGTCLLGMSIDEAWTKHNGLLVLDKSNGRSLGGHAVICTGYNNVGVFIQNSWGVGWGKYGFACVSWDVFSREFIIGAYIKNCLDGMES